MKKILIALLLGTATLLSWRYAMGKEEIAYPIPPEVPDNADINAAVSTSMNGRSSTTDAGVPISSTAASAESRNTSGSGD